jgi:hypothetical protein
VNTKSTVLKGQSISFRLPADLTRCGSGPGATLLPFSGAKVTGWAN